jgi:hypothetical protein
MPVVFTRSENPSKEGEGTTRQKLEKIFSTLDRMNEVIQACTNAKKHEAVKH